MYKFTVAIPTYNSSAYLKECILGFRNSTHIDEIIIGDDCSNEIEVEKIKLIINEVKKIMTCKISFIGNKENIGAFKNKYNLILNSRNQLVYQIDSDNVHLEISIRQLKMLLTMLVMKVLFTYPQN